MFLFLSNNNIQLSKYINYRYIFILSEDKEDIDVMNL